jgi:ketosteroid isomerase-like protein
MNSPLRSIIFLLLSSLLSPLAAQDSTAPAPSPNKQTVQAYMYAFNKLDHPAILACLTDDVEWLVPGAFNTRGKADFDKQIENDAFTGAPIIKLTRMIEERDIVVAEGTVRATRKDGGTLNLVFCDVFELRAAKIKRLTSYLMETKD